MSANSSDEIPDTPPPALPDTPPPDTLSSSSSSTLRRSPSPFSGPEKPPRTFSDAYSPNGSKTSRDSSPTHSGSFQTPPDSLQMTDVNLTPTSDELEKTTSSRSQTPPAVASTSFSSSLSPPAETSKKRSSTLSHLSPSDASENPSSDASQPPSDAPRRSSSSDVTKKTSSEVTKKPSLDVPTVSVVPADGDAAADEVFLESGDQSTTVLLRKPSQRRKASGDSKLKRVVSARIDRIGTALSRLLDRDKGAPAGDQERPKSMGAFEASIIRNDRQNGSAENRESIVPYGSTFLRRSFRQKSAEFEGEPHPPSPGSSTAGRQSVYNEDLVASLVCAACAHYMVAPIEQCKRGHNICKFCRRRAHQHRCPVCNARLSGIRNVVAEDMARKLLFPCVHAHAGCTRQVPNDELEFHEPRCPFRVYNCLINVASGVPCKWEGRRGELEEHVAAMHPRYYSPQETTKWRWSPNLLVKMEDFQLISAFGELFWYCAAQDPERLRVCWFVQHIGYDQDSVKYEYRFAFTDEEKDRRLEMTCTTLPDYSSVGSIVESGRCLDMSYQQALSFVDEEGTIKFSVTIYKLE